jgi:hypothetical protein
VKGGGTIEDKVIVAAYAAFRSGLKTALVTSGVALLIGAVIAAATVRDVQPPRTAGGQMEETS